VAFVFSEISIIFEAFYTLKKSYLHLFIKIIKIMEIGQRIKKMRELRNMTQEHMAEKLETTQQNYSRWEKGDIELTVLRLEQIAKILDVRPEDFFSFDEKVVFNNNYCSFSDNATGIGANQSVLQELKLSYISRIEAQQKEIDRLHELLKQSLTK
jgi:transcriptional regulator with XRE-family HTH domain